MVIVRFLAVFGIIGAGILGGCDDRGAASEELAVEPGMPLEETEQDALSVAADDLSAIKESVIANYADGVFATYSNSLAAAERLNAALQFLVETPSAGAMEAARNAWREARTPYLQTEAFRFYGGPIDHEETGVEGLMNAWPMDEAYVDYVEGNAEAGLINDAATYPEISKDLLVELNEKNGEANISTGYHAIEFLLWGQDFDADGPGARSFEDYSTAANADRRGDYLLAVGDLLVEHLQMLKSEWNPKTEDNFRAVFLSLPPDEALHDIFTGIGVLSGFEVSGERLAVAYETKEQEDEHSCFSDNTHVDMIEDARGIQNVWAGRYELTGGEVVEGPGLNELVAAKNEALADRLGEEIDATLAAAEALPVPFDQAIQGADDAAGRVAVATLIDDLRTQGATIVEAAKEFGLTIQLDGD